MATATGLTILISWLIRYISWLFRLAIGCFFRSAILFLLRSSITRNSQLMAKRNSQLMVEVRWFVGSFRSFDRWLRSNIVAHS